jgi:hypothetical protein
VDLSSEENEAPTIERQRRKGEAPSPRDQAEPRKRRSETMLVRAPRFSVPVPSLWWLVVLAVILAGAIGYYAGSLRH